MKNILLIRIPPMTGSVDENTSVQWGEFTPSGELKGNFHISSVKQLKQEWLALLPEKHDEEEIVPDRIVMLLPGKLTIHKQITISSAQKKHLATALPFLIEEEVAEEIDSLHIASRLDRKNNVVFLSAITHEKMQGLLNLFDQHHLPLDQVIAETQLVTSHPDFTTLLLDNSAVILAALGQASVSIDYGSVSFALEGQSSQSEHSESVTTIISDNSEVDQQLHLSQIKLLIPDGSLSVPTRQVDELANLLTERGWLVSRLSLPGSVFEFLAEQYFSKRQICVDLRQGAYHCPRKAGLQLRKWLPVLAVTSCWLILEFSFLIGKGLLYQYRADKLWAETMATYIEIFPNDQQAKNAQNNHQMSFNVKKLLENRINNSGNNQTGESFLPLLQKVSSASNSLGKESGVIPKSLEFNSANGLLSMELQASNLELVDQFLLNLKNAGLNSRLENATQGKEGVSARMTIGK